MSLKTIDERMLSSVFSSVLSPASRDSFGRLRVSQPYNIFDSKQLVDSLPLVYDDQQVSGSGTTSTYVGAKVCTTIAVSNLTAGLRVRQTFERFCYQPGKSQLMYITFKFGVATTGITRRVGLFDGTNGNYLKQTSAGLFFCKVSAGTEQAIAQANWNKDKLDGTGSSGYIIDHTAAQIFWLDFEWLGVGLVRFGFIIDGKYIVCHEAYHANRQSTVYNINPNSTVRYDIQNDGTGPSADMDCICASVMSEGGSDYTGILRSADLGTTGFTAGNDTNLYPALSIRLKSTHIRNTAIALDSLGVYTAISVTFRWALLLNPTIAGTALNFGTSLTNSAIEVTSGTTNASTVSAEGTRIASGYGGQSGAAATYADFSGSVPIRLGANIAGTSDILTLAIGRATGTGTGVYFPTMTWRELT